MPAREKLPTPVVRAIVMESRRGKKPSEISRQTGVAYGSVYAILTMTVPDLRRKYGTNAFP